MDSVQRRRLIVGTAVSGLGIGFAIACGSTDNVAPTDLGTDTVTDTDTSSATATPVTTGTPTKSATATETNSQAQGNFCKSNRVGDEYVVRQPHGGRNEYVVRQPNHVGYKFSGPSPIEYAKQQQHGSLSAILPHRSSVYVSATNTNGRTNTTSNSRTQNTSATNTAVASQTSRTNSATVSRTNGGSSTNTGQASAPEQPPPRLLALIV